MFLNCGVGKESWDSKEIKPVNPKRNQSWIFIRRTDAEVPILWSPDVKIWLIGKDPDDGKDWGQKKGMTKDEIIGWYHQLNGKEFEQTPGDRAGQGNLGCCSPWRSKGVRHHWAIEHHCSQSFENINSSYLDNNSSKLVLLLYRFYKWRNWRADNLGNLPQIT